MVFNGDESLMHDSVVRWGNIIEDIIRSHHCYSMVMRICEIWAVGWENIVGYIIMPK